MPDGEVEIATEATVKLWVDDERLAAVGEGNGPVNALDAALRRALNGALPGARPHPPHRLQGPGARRRWPPPARSCGC